MQYVEEKPFDPLTLLLYPGKGKNVITLADGETISLDSGGDTLALKADPLSCNLELRFINFAGEIKTGGEDTTVRQEGETLVISIDKKAGGKGISLVLQKKN
jgi:hypothetical protein